MLALVFAKSLLRQSLGFIELTRFGIACYVLRIEHVGNPLSDATINSLQQWCHSVSLSYVCFCLIIHRT